jgi:uncharacterized membrane protein YhiD involved in acid resistance
MGLGLGANQIIPTIVASLVILSVVALLRRTRREAGNKNLYLAIDWKDTSEENPGNHLERLNEVISRHVLSSDLRRFDVRAESVEATYLLDIESTDKLNSLVDELRRSYPLMGVTFLDQNQLPSV